MIVDYNILSITNPRFSQLSNLVRLFRNCTHVNSEVTSFFSISTGFVHEFRGFEDQVILPSCFQVSWKNSFVLSLLFYVYKLFLRELLVMETSDSRLFGHTCSPGRSDDSH